MKLYQKAMKSEMFVVQTETLNQECLVSTEKGVPMKMWNQRWLVLYLYRQESNQLD